MDKPNLLIIHTDQQSTWSIGAYGGTVATTPHTDRLAREGALFTQFFTNSAICTPSRGCFVTGRYPHAHGAYANNLSVNRDEISFAQVLRCSGYATGYAGKWHLNGICRRGWMHEERSMGFSDGRFCVQSRALEEDRGLPDRRRAAAGLPVFGARTVGDR